MFSPVRGCDSDTYIRNSHNHDVQGAGHLCCLLLVLYFVAEQHFKAMLLQRFSGWVLATPCRWKHSEHLSCRPKYIADMPMHTQPVPTLVITCQDLTRHASDKRASQSYEAPGATSRHASPESPPGRRESERGSQRKPLPPLQGHARYERGYFVSERTPP